MSPPAPHPEIRARRAARWRGAAGLRWALVLAALLAAPDVPAQLYTRFGDVQWHDSDGAPLAFDALRGQPVIMTMSYTACRKTCSTSMLVLREIQQILARRGRSAAFVVVSYDPDRDSPDAWRRYRAARKLPDDWHFVSGPLDATRSLASFLELRFWPYDDHVLHDFRIVVFDADGRRRRDILWEQLGDLEKQVADL